jgi:1-acyl-sn-glycerol-3-phosphate acyltransferase
MGVSDSAYAVWKTLGISVWAVVNAPRGRLTREGADEKLAGWAAALIRRAEVDLHVHAEQPVDWSRAYVVMSNHQSHYDIPILYGIMQGTLRMVAKTELFKVPIWGRAMRQAGMVEVDRSDRKQAVESLRHATHALRDGVNIWIAPEGTRSRTGELGTFKKGGFHLAREAGAPILPIAIRGSREIIAAKAAVVHRGKRVDVTIGAPIQVEGRDTPALMALVRSFLEQHLKG